MDNELNIKSRLDFSETDLTAPDEVLKGIFEKVASETNGIVHGGVETHSGPIESYYKESSFQTLQKAVSVNSSELVSIQDSLGARGEDLSKFEAYLYTPVYKHYRYRLFFLQYGIAHYPAKVVLEQGIANEINKGDSYIINCKNREKLEELIYRVLSSDKIVTIMQELIRIYQIKKDTKELTLEEADEA